MLYRVLVHKRVAKDLEKVPVHVARKLNAWCDLVEKDGLEEAWKIPGFHDEPVRGKEREGQRSVRLSRAYRAFYRVLREGVTLVLVKEVNRHEY